MSFDEENAVAKQEGIGTLGGHYRTPPVRKILLDQIEGLKRELQAREELLKKLDENPNVEEILNAMRRVGI